MEDREARDKREKIKIRRKRKTEGTRLRMKSTKKEVLENGSGDYVEGQDEGRRRRRRS